MSQRQSDLKRQVKGDGASRHKNAPELVLSCQNATRQRHTCQHLESVAMTSTTARTPSDELRGLAAVIRDNPNAREAIANGFELIAAAMEPCFDCDCPDLDDVMVPEDPQAVAV